MKNDNIVSAYSFRYEDTVIWDAVYDVIVIGFGGSGAPAAAAAADAGAKVLLTEKALKGKEGGNARVSGQHLLSFTDYEKGVKYMKKCRLGLELATPDAFVEQFVAESMKFEKWWNGLGYTEYEKRLRSDFPFEGGDSAFCFYTDEPGTQRYWNGLKKLVSDRSESIDVWYDSPACGLIQDPFSKTVPGVKIRAGGKAVNVRAKNGVVMALGGFEDNSEMLQNYGNIPYPADSDGANTGDGIRMAISVGAKLARMSAISGPYATFTDPENNRFIFHLARFRKHIHGLIEGNASIMVGPDGTRFFDETTDLKHGDYYYHGNYQKMIWPRPAYLILDGSVLGTELHNGWGNNNEAGIEKGYLHTGGTAEELAEKIGVDPKGLAETIARYNGFCNAGRDDDFGRTNSLEAFTGRGYCAILVTPGRYNTTGGPDRTLSGEILDINGDIIPNLYGCGDLGGFGIGNYCGGYGLMEAWYSGRIAGESAAKEKKNAPEATVNIYRQPDAPGFRKEEAADELGELSLGQNDSLGAGEGMYGPITVKVTRSNGVIEQIEVLKHKEDEPIGGAAMKTLIPMVIGANSADVDTISGATLSSNGFLEAIRNAISKQDQTK